MRRRLRLIRYIILLVVMILVAGLLVLVLGRMDETVNSFGVVEPAQSVKVKPQVSGIIENVFVDENDVVQAGDTLVTLHDDELRFDVHRSEQALVQSEADLAALREEYHNLVLSESFETQSAFANLYQARRSAEIAKERYERSQELFNENLISSEERDERQLNYELSESYYRSLRERAELLRKRYLLRIEEKEKAVELNRKEFGLAKQRLCRSVITAPITGGILTPNTEQLVGEMAVEGKAILEIGDLSHMDFITQVREEDIPKVAQRQEARIFMSAFPHRKYKVFNGEVVNVSSRPAMNSRGLFFEVRIRLADPWIESGSSTIALRPGLSGEAKIVTRYRVRLFDMMFGIRRQFEKP